jgi:hypothetical protein
MKISPAAYRRQQMAQRNGKHRRDGQRQMRPEKNDIAE